TERTVGTSSPAVATNGSWHFLQGMVLPSRLSATVYLVLQTGHVTWALIHNYPAAGRGGLLNRSPRRDAAQTRATGACPGPRCGQDRRRTAPPSARRSSDRQRGRHGVADMNRIISALLFVMLSTATAVRGDDQPSLPKPPEGWKAVTAKDGSYQVFFPADPQ